MKFKLSVADTETGPVVTLTTTDGEDTYVVFQNSKAPPGWRRGSIVLLETEVELPIRNT